MRRTTDTLSVWRFAAPGTADAVVDRVEKLVREHVIEIDDAALISWPASHRKPTLHELGSLAGPGALWGGFWGVLLALIFLVPIAGPTFGAAAGAVAGGLSDFGVEDDFVKRVRDTVTPGTSALFLIGASGSLERIQSAFEGVDVEMIRSDLSYEQTQHLHDALGDESTQVG